MDYGTTGRWTMYHGLWDEGTINNEGPGLRNLNPDHNCILHRILERPLLYIALVIMQ